MKEKKPLFCIKSYKTGDRVRLFGTKQQCIIVYVHDLKKYFVLVSDGTLYHLEASHYDRIRSVQRNNKIIAKRKSRNQALVQVRS